MLFHHIHLLRFGTISKVFRKNSQTQRMESVVTRMLIAQVTTELGTEKEKSIFPGNCEKRPSDEMKWNIMNESHVMGAGHLPALNFFPSFLFVIPLFTNRFGCWTIWMRKRWMKAKSILAYGNIFAFPAPAPKLEIVIIWQALVCRLLFQEKMVVLRLPKNCIQINKAIRKLELSFGICFEFIS